MVVTTDKVTGATRTAGCTTFRVDQRVEVPTLDAASAAREFIVQIRFTAVERIAITVIETIVALEQLAVALNTGAFRIIEASDAGVSAVSTGFRRIEVRLTAVVRNHVAVIPARLAGDLTGESAGRVDRGHTLRARRVVGTAHIAAATAVRGGTQVCFTAVQRVAIAIRETFFTRDDHTACAASVHPTFRQSDIGAIAVVSAAAAMRDGVVDAVLIGELEVLASHAAGVLVVAFGERVRVNVRVRIVAVIAVEATLGVVARDSVPIAVLINAVEATTFHGNTDVVFHFAFKRRLAFGTVGARLPTGTIHSAEGAIVLRETKICAYGPTTAGDVTFGAFTRGAVSGSTRITNGNEVPPIRANHQAFHGEASVWILTFVTRSVHGTETRTNATVMFRTNTIEASLTVRSARALLGVTDTIILAGVDGIDRIFGITGVFRLYTDPFFTRPIPFTVCIFITVWIHDLRPIAPTSHATHIERGDEEGLPHWPHPLHHSPPY